MSAVAYSRSSHNPTNGGSAGELVETAQLRKVRNLEKRFPIAPAEGKVKTYLLLLGGELWPMGNSGAFSKSSSGRQ